MNYQKLFAIKYSCKEKALLKRLLSKFLSIFLTKLLKNPFKIAKMIKNRKSALETSPITVLAPLKAAATIQSLQLLMHVPF